MQCPSCDRDNADNASFCSGCGTRLLLNCGQCGRSLALDASFCDACGAPVGVSAASDASADAATGLASKDQPTSFADGRYQVTKFLGEGGKKLVYLAHDDTLDREVAFALIKTEGLDETSRTRITREAQAMARLIHPHIVTVFDLGEHDGQPYIVTENMDGGDVEGVIEDADDNRIPLEQAIEFTKATCRGLELAHSKGIVHRDLKPGNVMLTADGTAKIGDFGLAVATDRSRLTQEGMMVGTVSYMPPEQAMGGEVTPQADLYSLGAMLYEMVTGRPPFVGDDSVAIIGQHLNTPPVAPTWHNPDIPPALETLVLRLLEKDASSRPASASDVLDALDAIDVASPGETRSSDAPPEGPDPTYRHTFVGREVEVRQLHTAFDKAMSGEGSLVMVVGEPGIGKTTICEQLGTYAKLRGGMTLVGHCYEEGSLSLPYLAFVEAMRSYVLERDPDGLRSDLGSGASEVARIVSEVRERLDVEPSPAGDPEQDRYRLMQSVTSFLTNASSVQPLVIVLEDLHDADRGTLDMLTHVSRNLSGARLMIVGTYRDVEVDRSHPLSGTLAELRRVASFDRIGLRGLTADEVQRMMAAISGHDVQWGVSEAVYRQTEGNPLFVQEVLRYLVEEGMLAHGHEGSERQTPPEMRIPEGLTDVIGKRLSRLSTEANSVLSIAAVLGREFRLDVLETVAGLSEDDLFAALEEAQAAAVIEERSATGTGVGFRFAHAFFRQTLYEETFAPRRLRLHQQVGLALEDAYRPRLEEHAAELAEHFGQSTDSGDLEKALNYSEVAARRAMAVYAYSEAVHQLERCLQVQEVVNPDDDTGRCDLLLALGEAAIAADDPERALDTTAPEALEIAQRLGDKGRSVRACRVATDAISHRREMVHGRWPEYRRWVEVADEQAEPGTRDRIWADLELSRLSLVAGQWEESWMLAQRAIDQSRELGDRDSLFHSVYRILGRPCAPKHQKERSSLALELADMPGDGATDQSLMERSSVCGFALLEIGERDRGVRFLRAVQEMASRTRHPSMLTYSRAVDSFLAMLDGDLEKSIGAAQVSVPWKLHVLLHLGRPEEALALWEELSMSYGEDLRDYRRVIEAVCLVHLGKDTEARQAYEVAKEMLPSADERPASLLRTMLQVAVSLEDRGEAEVLSAHLHQVAHVAGAYYEPSSTARHLGSASSLLGKPDEAHDYYRQALEVTEKICHRPELALTRLELAELLLDHYPDERAEALEHLDFAIAELRDMKMQPALERALSRREILKA